MEYFRMSMKEINDLMIQEFAFLDTKDLTPLLEKFKNSTLDEFMDRVEQIYEKEYLKKYPNDSYLFNAIDKYDFEIYLKDKYKINKRSEIIENIYIC